MKRGLRTRLAAVAVACLGIAAMTHRANAIVGEAAWPPTPDSNCVKFTNELTIKPIQSGMKTYSDSYDSVGQCFRKCRRRAGYMYIVENTSSGQCYCYNLENEREWGFTSHNGRDTEDDVLYSIENCFRLPTRECPPYDQPVSARNPSPARPRPQSLSAPGAVGQAAPRCAQEVCYLPTPSLIIGSRGRFALFILEF